jgi:hypothetical protein
MNLNCREHNVCLRMDAVHPKRWYPLTRHNPEDSNKNIHCLTILYPQDGNNVLYYETTYDNPGDHSLTLKFICVLPSVLEKTFHAQRGREKSFCIVADV